MRDREKRCSECLQLQDKEMESPYVCEGCVEDNLLIEQLEKVGDDRDLKGKLEEILKDLELQ